MGVCVLVLAALPIHAALPKLYRNFTKYRDAGAKPATGRSGSAAIAVRALRGQTQTDIEVTTGEFESSSAATGNLDKIQLKVYSGDGRLITTDNYKKSLTSSGYARFSYDWVSRGQSIQVQANVSGVDANRSDIVTVAIPVKLRPHIQVTELQNLNVAKVRTLTVISATLREVNGDVGARANCILKIDGIAVDRANGVWIDAGDSVACEFTHRFTSLGEKQLSVEVTDVTPADYDASNNSVTGQINIVELGPSGPIQYSFGASDLVTDVHQTSRHLDDYRYDNPVWNHSYESTFDIAVTYRTVFYQAAMYFDRKVTFPVLVESSLSQDGVTVLQNAESLSVTESTGMEGQCGFGAYTDGRRWLMVCTWDTVFNGLPYEFTLVDFWSQSGRTTYYSTVTSRYRDFGIDNVYTTSEFVQADFGQQPTPSLGNHVTIHAVVTDRNSVNEVEASVDLLPFSESFPPGPETCNTWDEPIGAIGRYTGYDCGTYSSHSYGTRGFADGTQP